MRQRLECIRLGRVINDNGAGRVERNLRTQGRLEAIFDWISVRQTDDFQRITVEIDVVLQERRNVRIQCLVFGLPHRTGEIIVTCLGPIVDALHIDCDGFLIRAAVTVGDSVGERILSRFAHGQSSKLRG